LERGIIFSLSSTLQYFFIKTLLEVSEVSQWRLWFIGNYNNSSQVHTNVGWSGIRGTIQYYGYYLSPIIFFFGIFLVAQHKRITRESLTSITSLYYIAALTICVVFAEILPRLNTPFIPERYWVYFGITFLFFALSLVAKNALCDSFKRWVVLLCLLACMTGIGASIYIASEKKSLTTIDEYATALWLQANTPLDAVIISQPGNGPLVRNFAKREILVPDDSFFVDTAYTSLIDQSAIVQLEKILHSLEESRKKETRPLIVHFRKMLAEKYALQQKPLYILYSEQKFSTLYSGRDWFQKQNFRDAHLEKFDASLEKIYSFNGISLWKVNP
jgi:hypothetical protein